MKIYKITHQTRIKWVHDEHYETRAADAHELEKLQSGRFVALGAIVETRCNQCQAWTETDSSWGIVVDIGADLEELGSELLEIPRKKQLD